MSARDKVCIFIDGGYVRAMLHQHYGDLPIDFLRFSDELCQGCERFRTYYYICPPYQSANPTLDERRRKSDMDRFLEKLKLHPRFENRLGRLQRTNDPTHPYVQKGVDVLLSIDLTQISASRTVDRVIIVSADSDFAPAIQRAKENMVLVTLASFTQHKSYVLYSICDERIEITKDMINRVALNQKP
jgi:uncharacterized LabA/DUF88 family protein